MNNPQRALVNQQLYFAKLHLGWLEPQQQAGVIAGQVLEQSLAESTLFHLQLAYRFYLAEIATAYGRPCHSLTSVDALDQQLSTLDFQPAELQELKQLEQQGWLQELLEAFEALMQGELAQAKPSANTQLIPALQLQSKGLSTERCQHGLSALQGLIDSQRARLEEW